MKKLVLGLVFVLLFAIITIAHAHGPGWGMGNGMMGGQGGWYCPYCGQYIGPRSGYGYGMGPGMMGPGYGAGQGYGQSEECQKFLDGTVNLRKELYNKRFEYSEAMRNPKTTQGTAAKLENEIQQLQEDISGKAPRGCWW